MRNNFRTILDDYLPLWVVTQFRVLSVSAIFEIFAIYKGFFKVANFFECRFIISSIIIPLRIIIYCHYCYYHIINNLAFISFEILVKRKEYSKLKFRHLRKILKPIPLIKRNVEIDWK